MNKILQTILMSLIAVTFITAQDAIRYQGVAFDANGQAILSSNISILFTIVEGLSLIHI